MRLVSASYPPVAVFEDTAWPADLEVVLAVLAITDPAARDAAGDLSLVAPEHRVSGPGSSPLMAAFTHPNPAGSRFADATFGVYYAARTLATAIAETRFHQTRALAAARTRTTEVTLDIYAARIDARVHDVRDARDRFPACCATDPAKYARTQALARALRAVGAGGLVYDSVRHAGGGSAWRCSPRSASRYRSSAPVTSAFAGTATPSASSSRSSTCPEGRIASMSARLVSESSGSTGPPRSPRRHR